MEKIKHLIDDVFSLTLDEQADDRGSLTEIYRQSWHEPTELIQWNITQSRANVLRGVHVHFRHYDYLFVCSGGMRLGLKDFRKDSATQGEHDVLVLEGAKPTIWIIPPGVAHGFYFPVDSTLFYGVTHYWDTADEISCHWNDPGLGFTLSEGQPILSERDASASSLEQAIHDYHVARDSHE